MVTDDDYKRAKELGLTSKDRWGTGIPHHPMSERLMAFIEQHDFRDFGDYFRWKVGGDGDNGETLMYEMDAFFELLDSDNHKPWQKAKCPACGEVMLSPHRHRCK